MTEKAAHDEVGGILKCLWEDITAKFNNLEELPQAQFDVVSKVGCNDSQEPHRRRETFGLLTLFRR